MRAEAIAAFVVSGRPMRHLPPVSPFGPTCAGLKVAAKKWENPASQDEPGCMILRRKKPVEKYLEKDLIELIGLDAYILFVENFGGARLYVAKNVVRQNVFQEAIGEAKAAIISEAYGGGTKEWKVPTSTKGAEARRLVDLVGQDAVEVIIGRFGGRQIWLGERDPPHNQIRDAIGIEAAELLAEAYGGEYPRTRSCAPRL